jgi:hypothetical protein
MITNAVRAAYSRLTRQRIPPTRRPSRQALRLTKRQLQIRLCPANLDLTACRWCPCIPHNTLTGTVRRLKRQRLSGKAVAEDVAHVVPDLVDVEVVCEDGLADVGFGDSAFNGRDLEGDATGLGVSAEGLAVGLFGVDGVLLAHAAADGPEVDWFGALVGYYGAAGGMGACDKGGDSEHDEEHFDQRFQLEPDVRIEGGWALEATAKPTLLYCTYTQDTT